MQAPGLVQVTQLVIQFTQVQLNDESLAAMGQKKAGLAEVLDSDTIMWLGSRLEAGRSACFVSVSSGTAHVWMLVGESASIYTHFFPD